jgi:outer membrane protein assembly factor BamB
MDDLGIARMTREGTRVWSIQAPFHHDLDLDAQGRIVAITADKRNMEPGQAMAFLDQVVVLDLDGKELARHDLLEALRAGSFDLVLNMSRTSGDIMHTNTVHWLDGGIESVNPAFKDGNVLITSRHLNLTYVLDTTTGAVVWQWMGPWRYPHETQVVDDRHLMILDNRGHGGMSKVIEFDLATLQTTWGYYGDASNGFYTSLCGALQRLPNDNTLVTSSDEGRAFELTRAGEIVWQWTTPETIQSGDKTKVVRIHEVRRVDRPDWLDHAP